MRQRDRISLLISGLALATSVLVIGGALRWTQATVALLVAVALATQLLARRSLDRMSPIILALLVAIGLTALQLVPLPESVISALNPTEQDLRQQGAALAHTSPWPCLSMDPAGTLRALAFFTTLLGVAALSLRFAASERGRYLALSGVAIVCGLAAAVTGIHTLINADSLYGMYEPVHATPPVLGPLLNPNHLGGLMAFGAVLSIGLAFYERQATYLRVLWLVIAMGCVIVALASLSRGAALSLGIGITVTGALLIARRFGRSSDPTRRGRAALARDLPIAIVVVVGLAVAVFTSAGSVADQLENTSVNELSQPISKYEAWVSSLDLISESPWVGEGRGALEPTFTRVHDASAYVTFSHLENEYLQPIVEWGIPGSFVMALVLAWCMITAMRRWRDGALAAAALGAMAGIMFQSSVDFGVELLGLAVPVTIVASTLMLVPFREPGGHSVRGKALRILMIAALGASAYVLLRPETRSLQEDHDAILAEQDAPTDELRDVIERHPLDYFGFAEIADEMVKIGDPRGVKYLNQALELHPTHPSLHRLVARLLAGDKRTRQAALEYSLAMHGSLVPKDVLAEIVTVLPDVDDAAAAIPADFSGVPIVLHNLTELKREDVSEHWLLRVISRPQEEPHLIDELYNLAMQRKDYPVAKQAALARKQITRTTTTQVMLARVEFELHEYAELRNEVSDVKSWRGRLDEQSQGWLLLCDSYKEEQNFDPAIECLHQLDASGLMVNGKRAEILKRLEEIDEHRAAAVKAKALQDLEHSSTVPDVPIVKEQPLEIPTRLNIPNPLKMKTK